MTTSKVQLDDRVTFNYIETTIPPGVTIADYRRGRPHPPARRVAFWRSAARGLAPMTTGA